MSTINSANGDPPSESSVGRKPFSFSLREILLLTTCLALASALFVQNAQLGKTKRALARYEIAEVSTDIAKDQFRIISQRVMHRSDLRIVTYRIESGAEFSATFGNRISSNSMCSRFNTNSQLYEQKIVVLIDHIDSKNALRVCASIGGISGYSLYSVDDTYELSENLIVNEVDGVYARNEIVDIFELDGRTYSLSLTK